MTGGFRDLTRTPGGPVRGRLPGRVGGPLMVLGALVLVGLLALVVALVLGGRGSDGGAPGDENVTVVNALEVPVGACLSSAGLSDPNQVVVTPCTQPHDASVFARLLLTSAETATDASIRTAADTLCQAAVPASAGTDVQVSFYYPTAEDASDNNDRRLTCVFDNSGDSSASP